VTPFQVYCEWVALSSHFRPGTYNYFFYNGKTKHTQEHFEKRNDRYHFVKLSRHRNPKLLMIAVLLNDPNTWVGNANGAEAEDLFLERERNIQSLSYHVKEQLGLLDRDFNKNFRAARGEHPPVLRLFLGGRVSIETMSVLAILTGFTDHWKTVGDPLLEEVRHKVDRYKGFLEFDQDRMKKVIMEVFTEE
jgi:hypothetical protein